MSDACNEWILVTCFDRFMKVGLLDLFHQSKVEGKTVTAAVIDTLQPKKIFSNDVHRVQHFKQSSHSFHHI